jgi:hypothetical protein
MGAKFRQEYFFHFFLLLETSEKLMKNDFSSVAEKKACIRKVFTFNNFRSCSFQL